ncbi:hypothetical protein [Salimicrobium halophilum]|uniref:YtxH-like protein n=1 Tax=Salimicrobium halophilum TaxID=86666 RepID=A0A1G8S3T2_9BACI|nr:hypothetical protein [Salimicrobium halophilum]SDJ23801.1 hypothetical protein SAMN04490247_1235 [Salimicrobium halophilum]
MTERKRSSKWIRVAIGGVTGAVAGLMLKPDVNKEGIKEKVKGRKENSTGNDTTDIKRESGESSTIVRESFKDSKKMNTVKKSVTSDRNSGDEEQ